uniref:Uncharacterized protein n=1 Tax=Pristionchus pacificus TaxID=54126 RepID=A0A2A6CK66_PRIPA|eukprot:PDM78500.1 hypothetical protein PRIPAC_31079 [Pristionchus pacificus]
MLDQIEIKWLNLTSNEGLESTAQGEEIPQER